MLVEGLVEVGREVLFLSGLNNFQCDKRGYIYVVRDMLIPRNATKEAFSEYGDGFGVCWSGFETSKPDVPYNKEKQVRIRVYALAPAESIDYEYSVFSFVGASEGEIGLKKGSQIEIGRIEAIVESLGYEYLDKDGDKDKRQAMFFNSLEDENRHTNKFTLPLNYPLIGKA